MEVTERVMAAILGSMAGETGSTALLPVAGHAVHGAVGPRIPADHVGQIRACGCLVDVQVEAWFVIFPKVEEDELGAKGGHRSLSNNLGVGNIDSLAPSDLVVIHCRVRGIQCLKVTGKWQAQGST